MTENTPAVLKTDPSESAAARWRRESREAWEAAPVVVRMQVAEIAATAAAAFDERGWTYYDGAPDADRLELTLWGLIYSACQNPEGWSCGSGRFLVSHEDDGDLEIVLRLGTIERFIPPDRSENDEDQHG